jgi:hypothetical protein
MEQNGSPDWVVPPVGLDFCADDSFDVFKEEVGESHISSLSENVGEEVPRVVVGTTFACGTERLAWESGNKEVHFTVKRSTRKGFKIRPDRYWVQESRFHFRNQVRGCEGFDLTNSNELQT